MANQTVTSGGRRQGKLDAMRGIQAQRVLRAELDLAEEKAIKAMAGYKFMMFGYWAAIWVHINQVGQFKLPNPFAEYVKLAKKKVKGGQDVTDSS